MPKSPSCLAILALGLIGVPASDAVGQFGATDGSRYEQVDAAQELKMLDQLRENRDRRDDKEPSPNGPPAEESSPRSIPRSPVSASDGAGVASDLPAALLKEWRISVVARVLGRSRQAITVRFSPRQQREDQQRFVDVLLTRSLSKANPVRVNLSPESRLVMLLDRVDPDLDSVTVTLRGEEIAGQPFTEDSLPIAID